MGDYPRGREPDCPAGYPGCAGKVRSRDALMCVSCARYERRRQRDAAPPPVLVLPDEPGAHHALASQSPPIETGHEDAVKQVLKQHPLTLQALSTKLGITPGQALDALLTLQAAGVNVIERGGQWELDRQTEVGTASHVEPYVGRASRGRFTHVFGWLSDNHCGSKYSRTDCLVDTYRRFADAGVDRVFHAGNWIDGEADFNRYDLLVHGMDAQIKYLIDTYPRVDGITTYAVAGNDHEGWYGKREGIDIGRHGELLMRQAGRDDWHHLGHMEAYIPLTHPASGKVAVLHVMHPGGGSAYSTSYTVLKIVESYEGGNKPAILLAGHYHKLETLNTRNVEVIQTGCFTSNTLVTTRTGRKRIKDVRVGDIVLTHRGRWRPVMRTVQRLHRGQLVRLEYGRKGQCVSATPEHPVYVQRVDGSRDWVRIDEIKAGQDRVFVETSTCRLCSAPVPYWMSMCSRCNPMYSRTTRDKLSDTKTSYYSSRRSTRQQRPGVQSSGEVHLVADIIPFCERMRADGWRMVPVGGGVIPDAIGIKDGRVVAFELERHTARSRLRALKEAKYCGAQIISYVDEVRWVDLTHDKRQPMADYEIDRDTGLALVPTLSLSARDVAKRGCGRTMRLSLSVYNLEVAEDNSYMAGRVAVHNCLQDQTPFARQKKLRFELGAGICELEQDAETGAIVSCRIETWHYFDRGFYTTNRWSHSGPVNLPARL